MPEFNSSSPNKFKLVFVIVFAFFLLVILFNVWIKSAFKETNNKKSASDEGMTESVVKEAASLETSNMQRSEDLKVEREKNSGSERHLLIQ